MNIFVTDPCPAKSAQRLDNKRVVKMMLETMQLIATALRHHGVPDDLLPKTLSGSAYRSTHVNHPCTLWAKESKGNLLWLVEHAEALSIEYMIAYNKEPAIYAQLDTAMDALNLLPDTPQTPFVNCSLYKDKPVFDAYQLTLEYKWAHDKRPPSWKGRR